MAGAGWSEVELACEGSGGFVDEGGEGEASPTGRRGARREELPHRLAQWNRVWGSGHRAPGEGELLARTSLTAGGRGCTFG
jgi:hypothetical protein